MQGLVNAVRSLERKQKKKKCVGQKGVKLTLSFGAREFNLNMQQLFNVNMRGIFFAFRCVDSD